jgi:UDP-3-O-[3-hydroxymyristoyl] N-acetylglucosamine deacetylase
LTLSPSTEKQKTVAREMVFSGIGLFTGEKSSLKILPAPADSGIVFQRLDLPGQPELRGSLANVRESPRCTRLADGKASVQMVEHLLSAFRGVGVDNARVLMEGPEIPSGDGSALFFVDLLEKAGIQEQEAPLVYLRIDQPVYWSEGNVHLIALPAPEFRLSYTIHYPQSALVRSQYYSLALDPKRYKQDIAPCRTFSFYEEILPFLEKGMIKGGGLSNALVIRGDQVMNPGGARFPDEMVRHKILDLIGDLSLLGVPLLAHVIAICSGHASHVAFAKTLAKHAHLESR